MRVQSALLKVVPISLNWTCQDVASRKPYNLLLLMVTDDGLAEIGH